VLDQPLAQRAELLLENLKVHHVADPQTISDGFGAVARANTTLGGADIHALFLRQGILEHTVDNPVAVEQHVGARRQPNALQRIRVELFQSLTRFFYIPTQHPGGTKLKKKKTLEWIKKMEKKSGYEKLCCFELLH